jgi:hypothetical protein
MEMARKNRRTDRGYSYPGWSRFVRGTVITLVFAAIAVWSARAFGRTVTFAFSINWLLAAWAILLGRALQSRSGAWDGLALQLPARYYVTRPFEKGGRIYDYLGTGWYKRLLRRVLWTVNPTQLRSRPDARQTMIAGTRAAEAGHLLIFVVITGFTLQALFAGWWDTAGWLLLFNLLHNGYPVLSMRQLRARLNGSFVRTRRFNAQRVASLS